VVGRLGLGSGTGLGFGRAFAGTTWRPAGRTGLIVGGGLSSCTALLAASSLILCLFFWLGFHNLFLKRVVAACFRGGETNRRGDGAREMTLSGLRLWLGLQLL
jgi:hypothetical protein